MLSSDQSIQQIYKITTEALKPKFKYHLNAIVSHIGEPSTGQYSAYIRYRYKHMQYWVLHCSNKKVLVSEKQALSADGVYQLFYERDDTQKNSVASQMVDITINTAIAKERKSILKQNKKAFGS